MMTNCCDHARRMYEVFDLKVFSRKEFKEKPPRFYISLPHVITNEGFEYYFKEMGKLKKDIEEKYKVTISNEDLKNSIELYNENRRLMREIHKLRILDKSRVTGLEALQIAISNCSVPKEIANQELKKLLDIFKTRTGNESNNKRIMLIGSVIDNKSFIEILQNAGADIISDFLCFGTRLFNDDVDLESNGNPLEAITKRVYYRISCPRMMDDHPRRLDFVKEKINEGKIDGVIVQRINNCDLHGCENMMLEHELKDLQIPVFNIDRENFQKDYTRIRTRIEAFLEMIK
jgi:benzoyl-CoA reductase/2-hydroxyglutaryl-CoA dehydratase subunit BcrC/BadD/HgdB